MAAFATAVLSLMSATEPARAATPACDDPAAMHEMFSSILSRRVHDGFVDYARLKKVEDPALRQYLTQISATTRACYDSWPQRDRFAFWINAYNAYTLRLILDHYPVASIRSIGWLPGAAFREPFINMPGLRRGPFALNDIEHGILRPEFRDARVHFAIVCASKSCPALRSEAYRGPTLEEQLSDQAKRFLADASKNTFDAGQHVLRLSEIFKWFREDFERDAGTVPAYVRHYASPPMAAVAAVPDVRIEFLEYDWSLNGQ